MGDGRVASKILSVAAPLLSRDFMRPVTRVLTNLHARAYRLTRGRAQVRAYPTMVLTVTGRRTGQPRAVPLVYVRDGERYVVAAAPAEREGLWRKLAAMYPPFARYEGRTDREIPVIVLTPTGS